MITDHDGPGGKSYTFPPFLGGQCHSIADIATLPMAREVDAFLGEPAEADYPKLMTWVGTINSRPATTRALAAVDQVRAKTTQFDKAGEVARDRLFGRGRDAGVRAGSQLRLSGARRN